MAESSADSSLSEFRPAVGDALFLSCEVFTDAGIVLRGCEAGSGFAAEHFLSNLVNLMCFSQTEQRRNDGYEQRQGAHAAGGTDTV